MEEETEKIQKLEHRKYAAYIQSAKWPQATKPW
jgi:hypothetical protein